MSTLEQPRDAAGRFASLPELPPMAPAVEEYERNSAAVARRLDRVPAIVRPALPDVPASVVSVCCAGCVYGARS